MFPKFIVVSGLIGAGKSTLIADLNKILGYRVYQEPAVRPDNPYFADYCKDPKKWAYTMASHLQSLRFSDHMQAQADIRLGVVPGVIMERSVWEDYIFAKINADIGNIDEASFKAYIERYHNLLRYLDNPDLVIGLEVSLPICGQRIKKRGRPGEENLVEDTSYQEMLRKEYDEWYKTTDIKKLSLPWNYPLPACEVVALMGMS